MIERQFIESKKREFIIREFVKSDLGKGKVSEVDLERTPLGDRIVVHTTKPGLIIGRKGESIQKLTQKLKKRFKLENPQVEIAEIGKAEYDAQFMADSIASSLERFGPLRFKAIAYRTLKRIIDSKALGAEIRIGGKLPSERAKSWRFAFGYLKKTGEPSNIIVNKAYSVAFTKPGAVGIKVFIVPPTSDVIDIKEKKIIEEAVNEEINIEEIKKNGKGNKEKKTTSKEKEGKKKETSKVVQEDKNGNSKK